MNVKSSVAEWWKHDFVQKLPAPQPQVPGWAPNSRSLLEEVGEEKLARSPYRVAEQFSRGEISRDQVVEALVKWQYVVAETKTDGLDDDLLNYVVGSFDEVQAASLDELIDEDIYAVALESLKAQTAAIRQTSGG